MEEPIRTVKSKGDLGMFGPNRLAPSRKGKSRTRKKEV